MTDDKTVKEWKVGEDEKAMKKIFDRIFINGLSGMALGLFSTLIIGTILAQIGELVGGTALTFLFFYVLFRPCRKRGRAQAERNA